VLFRGVVVVVVDVVGCCPISEYLFTPYSHLTHALRRAFRVAINIKLWLWWRSQPRPASPRDQAEPQLNSNRVFSVQISEASIENRIGVGMKTENKTAGQSSAPTACYSRIHSGLAHEMIPKLISMFLRNLIEEKIGLI
jgi:hypothetical protein